MVTTGTTTTALPPPTRRAVTGADGIELAVYERGPTDGPTVLLVHGFPDDHAVWDLVADRLAADHHVVTYDVRGAGRSGVPAGRDGYRMDALTHDVGAVARATSPDRPVHLVGHDWGSIQSWHAVTDPALAPLFASFTSLSGPSLDHGAAWVRARLRPGDGRWTSLASQGVRSTYIVAFHARSAGRVARRVARFAPLVMERREHAEIDDRWPSPDIADDAVHGLELYRANMFRRGGRRPPVPAPMPVQLIVADGDPYVTPILLEGIEALAPNLVRRHVAGRHWLPRSRPDQVARWVSEHVAAVEAGRPTPVDDGREVVVVTGAGSGIGRATCLAFADRGAHVVATDLRLETAEETASRCRERGGTAEAHAVDVTDPVAVEALADLVGAAHGAPTVVVNNAGLGMAGSFLAMSDDDWSQLLDVNLWGVIRGSRAFARLMLDHGSTGSIVNIASAAAFTPSRSMSGYATSKAAVLMLTECLRAELADQGIGVSAICPGFVDTNIAMATRYVGASADEEQAKRVSADRMYKRRHVTPEAVADAVVRAVDHDRPVVPVAAEARLGMLTARFAPHLRRAIAKIDLSPPTPRRSAPAPEVEA